MILQWPIVDQVDDLASAPARLHALQLRQRGHRGPVLVAGSTAVNKSAPTEPPIFLSVMVCTMVGFVSSKVKVKTTACRKYNIY